MLRAPRATASRLCSTHFFAAPPHALVRRRRSSCDLVDQNEASCRIDLARIEEQDRLGFEGDDAACLDNERASRIVDEYCPCELATPSHKHGGE